LTAERLPILASGEDIVVTFYCENGEIFDRITISHAHLMAMVKRLGPLVESDESRTLHPDDQCVARYPRPIFAD
jgi:hypothetical protein